MYKIRLGHQRTVRQCTFSPNTPPVILFKIPVNTPAEVRKNRFVGEAGIMASSLGMLSASPPWPFSDPPWVVDNDSPDSPWRVTACSVFVEGRGRCRGWVGGGVGSGGCCRLRLRRSNCFRTSTIHQSATSVSGAAESYTLSKSIRGYLGVWMKRPVMRVGPRNSLGSGTSLLPESTDVP